MSQGTKTGTVYQLRGVGWGGKWEGGDMGVPMADSCCCLTKSNKIL